MGQAARRRPEKLAEKLKEVRCRLRLSQSELIFRMDLQGELTPARVSAFENGIREPSLYVLLKYAQISGVWVDVLIDDELQLPAELPAARR